MKSMKISETQASILASVSASMFLWGIVASIGPLAASGSLVGRLPPYLKTFILLLGPAAGLLGDSLFGFLSDRAGRKKIFAATMM
ncbi:MAG: MFS transporter, partial [Thermoprotei archaeon]